MDGDDWDIVVLQEQSLLMVHKHYDDDDGVSLASMAREKNLGYNTSVFLLETWAYKRGWGWYSRNEMQRILRDGYIRVADKANATALLAGDTVNFLANEYDIEMWDQDGRHPSVATTAVAACSIFKALRPDQPCPVPDKRIVLGVEKITL
jgi:hypothetical protein